MPRFNVLLIAATLNAVLIEYVYAYSDNIALLSCSFSDAQDFCNYQQDGFWKHDHQTIRLLDTARNAQFVSPPVLINETLCLQFGYQLPGATTNMKMTITNIVSKETTTIYADADKIIRVAAEVTLEVAREPQMITFYGHRDHVDDQRVNVGYAYVNATIGRACA